MGLLVLGVVLVALGVAAFASAAALPVGSESRMAKRLQRIGLWKDDAYYIQQRRIVAVGLTVVGIMFMISGIRS